MITQSLVLLILLTEGVTSAFSQRLCTHTQTVVCSKYEGCCKVAQFCNNLGQCQDCFPRSVRKREDRLKFCRELDRKTDKHTLRHQKCWDACTFLFTKREINACDPTHYGVDCSLKCSDACYNQECDSVNGRCLRCTLGRTGDFCQLAIPNDETSFIGDFLNSTTSKVNGSYSSQYSTEDKNAYSIGFTIAMFIALTSVLVWYNRRRSKLKENFEIIVPHVNELREDVSYDMSLNADIYATIDDSLNRISDHSSILGESDVNDHNDVIDLELHSVEPCDVTVHPPHLPPRPVQQQYIELGLVPIERNENHLHNVLIHHDEGNGVRPSYEEIADIDGNINTTLPTRLFSTVSTVQDDCIDTPHRPHISSSTTTLDKVANDNNESLEETTIKCVNTYTSPIISDTLFEEHLYFSLIHERRVRLNSTNNVNNEEYKTSSPRLRYADTPTCACRPLKCDIECIASQLSELHKVGSDINVVNDDYLKPFEEYCHV